MSAAIYDFNEEDLVKASKQNLKKGGRPSGSGFREKMICLEVGKFFKVGIESRDRIYVISRDLRKDLGIYITTLKEGDKVKVMRISKETHEKIKHK